MIAFGGAGKTYRALVSRREVIALRSVSVELGAGEVVGIAGPNGAGKSTMISLMLGFLQPTDGTVSIEGSAPRSYIERHGVGYLPELVNLPPRWRVAESIIRCAVLAGVPAGEIRQRSREVMEELGLVEQAGRQLRQLSKGNLQRVGLAQALVGRKRILVLDEPTHGLDPLWTQRFREIVARNRSSDRLLVIASHNLDELERLADRVLILNRGRLEQVMECGRGPAAGADGRLRWRLVFEGEMDVPAVFPEAVAAPGRAGGWLVTAAPADLSSGLARLLAGGAVLSECMPMESRLETAFRAVVDR